MAESKDIVSLLKKLSLKSENRTSEIRLLYSSMMNSGFLASYKVVRNSFPHNKKDMVDKSSFFPSLFIVFATTWHTSGEENFLRATSSVKS